MCPHPLITAEDLQALRSGAVKSDAQRLSPAAEHQLRQHGDGVWTSRSRAGGTAQEEHVPSTDTLNKGKKSKLWWLMPVVLIFEKLKLGLSLRPV